MSEGKKEIPEFLIFDRLDELETITLKLMEKADLEEPSIEKALGFAKHASVIAEHGLMLAFWGYMVKVKNESRVRNMKDSLLKSVRGRGVIAERVDAIERGLSGLMDDVYEKRKSEWKVEL